MASPQKENGFTGTANELIEAICCLEVSGACHRILRFIERKTYGYQKKEDAISFTQFEEGTGLYRNTVNESLETLISMGVIIKDKSGYINKYKINKDYEKWTSNQKRTSNQNLTKTSNQKRNGTSNQKRTHKRKKEKKEISENLFSVNLAPLGDNKNNMAWKKQKGENEHYEEPSIDADLNEPSVLEEEKLQAEEREVNTKIRANLKLVEPIRGISFGIGKDMNFHVKIYRELLKAGWTHKTIISTFLEVVETPHWKEEKQKGNFPGMNTIQFHLRNKKPS